MYIIKVKGVAKIPDYVQLRDEKFTLLGSILPAPGIKHGSDLVTINH